MKRPYYFLILLSFTLTMCAAPPAATPTAAPAPTQPATITILLSMKGPGATNSFWAAVEQGARTAAAANGVTLNVSAPPQETDVAAQIQQIEAAIALPVQVIIVAPTDVAALNPTFNKAYAAHIPVLFVDTDTAWPNKLTFIGTDNLAGGRLAGKFICDTLGSAGGQVAIITGVLSQQTHIERSGGAEEAFQTCGLQLVAKQPADSLRDKGRDVMQTILTANPDVRAVFATNDLMALGAVEALRAAGKTGVVVVGFDASPDAVTSILAGEMTASVAQSPMNMGKFGVENALKAIANTSIPNRIDTGTTLVNRDNAAQFKP